jgi:hypothetical protein
MNDKITFELDPIMAATVQQSLGLMALSAQSALAIINAQIAAQVQPPSSGDSPGKPVDDSHEEPPGLPDV